MAWMLQDPVKVAEDRSLQTHEYVQAGIPDVDRTWTVENYQAAVAALCKLSEKDPRKLPRAGSPKSGAVFGRLVSRDILRIFSDPRVSLNDRLAMLKPLIEAMRDLLIPYAVGSAWAGSFDAEVVEMIGIMMDVMQTSFSLAREVRAGQPKNVQPTEEQKMGLDRMRNGLTTTLLGVLQMFRERSKYRASELAKLAGYASDSIPDIFDELSRRDRKHLLRRLKETIDQEKDEPLKGALSELQWALPKINAASETCVEAAVQKLNRGDLEGGVKDLDRALELDSKNEEAWGIRAHALLRLKRYSEAIDDCSRLIELEPSRLEHYVQRAKARSASGDVDGAIDDCTNALVMNGKYVDAYEVRAEVYAAKGNFNKALEDRDAIVNLRPRSSGSYYGRAIARKDAGDAKGAVEDLTRAIALDPKDASLYVLRSKIRSESDEWDQALEDANRAIEVDPKNPAGYAQRGRIGLLMIEPDKAAEDLRKAIELNPRYVRGHYDLAVAHFCREAWADALAPLRKVCELDPGWADYPQLRIWMARVRLGEREAASKDLKAHLARSKDEWVAAIGRYLLGELQEEAFLKAAAAEEERRAQAWFYLGYRKLLDGDRAGAAASMEKCVGLKKTEFMEHMNALAELQRLRK